MASCLKGVLHVVARPKLSVCRPDGTIILDVAMRLQVNVTTSFCTLVPWRGGCQILVLAVEVARTSEIVACYRAASSIRIELMELIVNQNSFREVDGMCRHCGNDEVVARVRTNWMPSFLCM